MLKLNNVLFPNDAGVITPEIENSIATGRYEADEVRDLSRLLVSGDVVLDIGGGTGFTAVMAMRTGLPAAVTCVEASPEVARYAKRLLDLNKMTGISVINAVVSDESGPPVTFYHRTDFWMSSTLSGPNSYVSTEEIRRMSLSEAAAESGANVIFCDIEGGETQVFSGAVIPSVNRIRIEMHDHVTGLEEIRRMFMTISELGFSYDPRFSYNEVVTFVRPAYAEKNGKRAYLGKRAARIMVEPL